MDCDEEIGRLSLSLHEGQTYDFEADGKSFMRIKVLTKQVQVSEDREVAVVRIIFEAPKWIEIRRGREWRAPCDVRKHAKPIGDPDGPPALGPVPVRQGLGDALRRRGVRADLPHRPR